jgi:hypothetical protein
MEQMVMTIFWKSLGLWRCDYAAGVEDPGSVSPRAGWQSPSLIFSNYRK